MCTSVHLSVSALRVFSYPLRIKRTRGPLHLTGCGPISPRLQTARNARPPKPPANKPMTNHKNSDLASQLGDLALDTRVQLRDLTSRPELNGR